MDKKPLTAGDHYVRTENGTTIYGRVSRGPMFGGASPVTVEEFSRDRTQAIVVSLDPRHYNSILTYADWIKHVVAIRNASH